MKKFYYGSHLIDSKDKKAVLSSLGNFLSQGPLLEKFEKKVANFVGAKYCIAVSNATAGLHLAIKALNLKKKLTSFYF